MFWFINNTVEDDSLEVQSKEHAVKAFNKLISERDAISNKMEPLIKERDSYESRQIELCDLARVCLVLEKGLSAKQFKKIRVFWDKCIEEHGLLTEKRKKLQLDISALSIEKKKIVEKAQNIFRDKDLDDLNMDFPYY